MFSVYCVVCLNAVGKDLDESDGLWQGEIIFDTNCI